MPMIIGGEYYKQIDMKRLQARQSSTWKRHDHNRQRKDYASEIVQPYDRNGQANEAFIDNYPEDSEAYGFVPSEAEIIGNDSGTEIIDQGAVEVYADSDKLIAELPGEYYGEIED